MENVGSTFLSSAVLSCKNSDELIYRARSFGKFVAGNPTRPHT